MILSSLRDDPAVGVAEEFTLHIDELGAGPVVIRIGGVVDRRTTAVLCQCVDEVLVSGRSLVFDLHAVEGMPDVLSPVVHATVLRVSRTRARVSVACSDAVAVRLQQQVPGLQCYSSMAEAVAAVSSEIVPETTVAPTAPISHPSAVWIDTTEALQGRYL